MKIQIWIHKSDAISGDITNYSFTRPYHDRNEEWVQVTISHDAFVQLEDTVKEDKTYDTVLEELNRWFSNQTKVHQGKLGDTYGMFFNTFSKTDEWLVDQYNRNRPPEQHIEDITQMPPRLRQLLNNNTF